MNEVKVQYVAKIGNEWLSKLDVSGVYLSNNSEGMLKIEEEEKVRVQYLLKDFNIKNVEFEIFDKERNYANEVFLNYTIKRILEDKVKQSCLDRAYEIRKLSYINYLRKFNGNSSTYIADIYSQTEYKKYEVKIEIDSNDKVIGTLCTCPNYTQQNNKLCKHIVALMLEIKD